MAMLTAEELSMSGKIEKLNAENYYSWKFDMKMILLGNDLWGIVEGSETLNPNANDAEKVAFRKRENRAMSCIGLTIARNLQIYVRNTKSSKEAWDSLANKFEEKSLSRKIECHRKLYSLRLGNKSMVDHVNELKTISENLEAIEDPVLEKDLVMILLSSLPEEYNNLLTILETLQAENLSWEYVRNKAITEFERKNHLSEQKDVDNALFSGVTWSTLRYGRICCGKKWPTVMKL